MVSFRRTDIVHKIKLTNICIPVLVKPYFTYPFCKNVG